MTNLKRGLDRLISLYFFPGATTTVQNDHSLGLDPKLSHDMQDGEQQGTAWYTKQPTRSQVLIT